VAPAPPAAPAALKKKVTVAKSPKFSKMSWEVNMIIADDDDDDDNDDDDNENRSCNVMMTSGARRRRICRGLRSQRKATELL
jgi:hypothetical protein